jgi:hypothetical protein
MSVDPYMRGHMRKIRSYISPFEIGKPLEGGCVGQIIKSNSDRFTGGNYVLGNLDWLSISSYWLMGAVGAIILFASVLLHELAHSLVALWYGLRVRQIILFIFGGVSLQPRRWYRIF